MTEQARKDFLKKVELQVQINRMQHGDGSRRPEEWAMIAGAHMGHLLDAAMRKDLESIEKELLHVTAPIVELYEEIKASAHCGALAAGGGQDG
ncbi:MAG: hypothetical protein HPY89_06045 [Pelotomaculum sp.]|nr:hypothetical protein [Pelotomaculum sp.]